MKKAPYSPYGGVSVCMCVFVCLCVCVCVCMCMCVCACVKHMECTCNKACIHVHKLLRTSNNVEPSFDDKRRLAKMMPMLNGWGDVAYIHFNPPFLILNSRSGIQQ